MTPEEADRIERRLEAFGKEVREALADLTKAVSAMKVLVHAPGECDIKDTVADLKTWRDKIQGKFAIIGLIAISTASVIGGLIVKFLK